MLNVNSSLNALNALATKISPGVAVTTASAVGLKNGDLTDLKQQYTASKPLSAMDNMR